MLVVDSSAVVDALGAGREAQELRSRLSNEELHAPTLVDYELVSAVRGLTVAGQLTAARAFDLLTDFDDLPPYRWPASDALRRRAFALRDNLSGYDAAYIALAEALECPLVTRDARLGRSNGHSAVIEVG